MLKYGSICNQIRSANSKSCRYQYINAQRSGMRPGPAAIKYSDCALRPIDSPALSLVPEIRAFFPASQCLKSSFLLFKKFAFSSRDFNEFLFWKRQLDFTSSIFKKLKPLSMVCFCLRFWTHCRARFDTILKRCVLLNVDCNHNSILAYKQSSEPIASFTIVHNHFCNRYSLSQKHYTFWLIRQETRAQKFCCQNSFVYFYRLI